MHLGLRRAGACLLRLAAACSAAKDPLDELTIGERGRVVRVLEGDAGVLDAGQSAGLVGVWPVHGAARRPADAARFQMAEGIASGTTGSHEHFTDCAVALKGSARALAIDRAAAELCQIPDGTHLSSRGFPGDRRPEVSHPLNLEVLD